MYRRVGVLIFSQTGSVHVCWLGCCRAVRAWVIGASACALITGLLGGISAPAHAREAAGAGLFLDIAGCLATPCPGPIVMFPQLRLLLGRGLVAGHLDLLPLLPTTGMIWMPFAVIQTPFPLSPGVVVTPYVGLAPVLRTVNAPAGSVEWLYKFGDLFSFPGFGFYLEVLFPVPFIAIPSVAFGSVATF
ncbi:MAG TPA: hypothetical protein VIL47_03835 [Candidatus Bipolaricaulota bacterium]